MNSTAINLETIAIGTRVHSISDKMFGTVVATNFREYPAIKIAWSDGVTTNLSGNTKGYEVVA